MTEHLVMTWKNIHAMLKTEDGEQLISMGRLVSDFGPELKRVGAIFEWHTGKTRRKVIACWPSIFKHWFMILQRNKYKLKQANSHKIRNSSV